MKWFALFALLAVLLAGCGLEGTAEEGTVSGSIYLSSSVSRFMDTEAGVVCWVYRDVMYNTGGLSCLPIGQTKLRP